MLNRAGRATAAILVGITIFTIAGISLHVINLSDGTIDRQHLRQILRFQQQKETVIRVSSSKMKPQSQYENQQGKHHPPTQPKSAQDENFVRKESPISNKESKSPANQTQSEQKDMASSAQIGTEKANLSQDKHEQHLVASNLPQSSSPSERDISFFVFILGSSKDIHYSSLVESLLRSDLANNTQIVVSLDGPNAEMQGISNRLRTRFRVSQLFHPFACSTAEQRHAFPKYGRDKLHARRYWKYTCTKHHWFWAMHRTWSYFRQAQWMFYLEEDFVVSKHIGTVIKELMKVADKSDEYLGAMTECRDNLWTVSGLMKRATWNNLLERVQFFCSFNDYNWDLSMKQDFIRNQGPTKYICAQRNFAFHTGQFGTGLTQGQHFDSQQELLKKIQSSKLKFFTETDDWTSLNGTTVGQLHTPHRGLGAFTSEDRDHCLYIHRWFQQRDTSTTLAKLN